MRKFLLILSLFLLPSCVYDYATEDHNTCFNYGLTPGTPEYADCRMRLDERRHYQKIERSRQEHEKTMARENINRIAEIDERHLEHERMLERERFNRHIAIEERRQAYQNRQRTYAKSYPKRKTTRHTKRSFTNFMPNQDNMSCKKDSRGRTMCSRVCTKDKSGKERCGGSIEEIRKQEYDEKQLRRQERERKRQEIIRRREERQKKRRESTRKREEAHIRKLQENAKNKCKQNPEDPKCKRFCFKDKSGKIICS